MPLPEWLGRFNRRVTNRVTGVFAGTIPGFGIVHHVGRRSGRRYWTPVNVFPREGAFVIALTYGTGPDWVRNVLAAGGCDLETRRRIRHLAVPHVVTDRRQRLVPGPVRVALKLFGVTEFLVLQPA